MPNARAGKSDPFVEVTIENQRFRTDIVQVSDGLRLH
jgi:hypothetical protein